MHDWVFNNLNLNCELAWLSDLAGLSGDVIESCLDQEGRTKVIEALRTDPASDIKKAIRLWIGVRALGQRGQLLSDDLVNFIVEVRSVSHIDVTIDWLSELGEPPLAAHLMLKTIASFEKLPTAVLANGPGKLEKILSDCTMHGEEGEELIRANLNALLEDLLAKRIVASDAELERFRELASTYPVTIARWEEFDNWYRSR